MMERPGANRMEAIPSVGLRLRRRHHRRDGTKTILVERLLLDQPFNLELDLSETIAEVKDMIYDQEGTPPMRQVLIYRGQRLNNDYLTLADYGAVEHGTFWPLLLVTRLHEDGHRPEGAMGTKTIIFVRGLDGVTTTLEVDLSETIADVQAMIHVLEGTHPQLQRLVFRGRQINRGYCTVEDYGFPEGSVIHLIRRLRGGGTGPAASLACIKIFVRKLDGGIFSVGVIDLTIRIYEVRAMIRQQEGIHQTQQHLVFYGQPLDDYRTLADYNIKKNSTLDLVPGPLGEERGPPQFSVPTSHKDEENGFVNPGQAEGVDDEVRTQESSGSEDQPLVVGHHDEDRNEQLEVVNDPAPSPDQLRQQQIRWFKYSLKALLFAITTIVTYLSSASTFFSTGIMVFKISIGATFIAVAALSITMPSKLGSALVYLSCFLLISVSYLLLVSFNKYYGYAIVLVPLPVFGALLQQKLLPGLTQQQRRTSNNDGDQNVDIEVHAGQAHENCEEDEHHFDDIFDLSAAIVNCGGFITAFFGNSLVGPVSAVGFLFYTMALGLYLMMVTTVRTVVLTPHAKYLAILLKVLLVITLITALIHGVRVSNDSSA